MRRIYARRLPARHARDLSIVHTQWIRSARLRKANPTWKEDIWLGVYREFLHRQQSGYCAFCDTLCVAGTNGAVEHFLPKSVHWRRKFDFGNWLLACRNCNSAKEVRDPALEPWIDPRRMDPSEYLGVLPTGDLEPRGELRSTRRMRAACTIDGTDLNCARTSRSRCLVEARQAQVQHLVRLVELREAALDAGERRLVRAFEKGIVDLCANPKTVFGGVCLCALHDLALAGTVPSRLYERALELRRDLAPSAAVVFA